MNKYEIGKVVESFRGHQEGVHFDISDEGATLLVFFRNPTKEEIEQFNSGKPFEIRFSELYGVIMITAKIGNLNWVDAPYNPHLSKNLTTFQFPGENQGLGLNLMLIDAASGEIKHIRMIGLSERFTKQLFGVVMEEKMRGFDEIEYMNSINKIYSTYKTSQIVKMSNSYCKINV